MQNNSNATFLELGTRMRNSNEYGFTYVALLILIAVMSVALAATGELWQMTMKRERELELLFVGNQFRLALTSYYKNSAGSGRYPMTLDDLLKDPRFPETRRHLRKIFPDPMSHTVNWGLLKGANGEIFGVYSRSEEEPAKKSNFNMDDRDFEGKHKYSEWVFMIPARNIMAPPVNQPAPALPPPGVRKRRSRP